MKMISSTSMTSIIGVTFGDDWTLLVPPPLPIAIRLPPVAVADRLRGDRAGAAGGGVELTGEARPAELAGDTLDQVIDHLLGDVRHLGGEVVDLGREVVERPHRGDGDDQTEGGRDER